MRSAIHAIATPMIAAGYVCGIVLLCQNRSLAWLVQPVAPVGQMTLTNYLKQSVAIIVILAGAGPGLGLAGRAGVSIFLPLVIAFFAVQIVFSHFWTKAFAFGPAEWLWRPLTYGSAPENAGHACWCRTASSATAQSANVGRGLISCAGVLV